MADGFAAQPETDVAEAGFFEVRPPKRKSWEFGWILDEFGGF